MLVVVNITQQTLICNSRYFAFVERRRRATDGDENIYVFHVLVVIVVVRCDSKYIVALITARHSSYRIKTRYTMNAYVGHVLVCVHVPFCLDRLVCTHSLALSFCSFFLLMLLMLIFATQLTECR